MQRNCDWLNKVTEGSLHGGPVDKYLMVQGVSTDSRTIQANQLYIPLSGDRFDGHHFITQAIENGAAASLWQSDHPLPMKNQIPLIVVPDTLLALQKMASAYREELSVQVIGITGSNGKTTTKDIVASVMSVKYKTHKTQGNLNNHIGVPLTLLAMPEDTEVAVIEMGMNHAKEIEKLSLIVKPDIVVITNIGESHIEFLGSREGIADAKLEIKEGLKKEGIILFDGDEPLLRERFKTDTHRQTTVGWKAGNDVYPYNVEQKGLEGSVFQTKEATFYLPLVGKHNIKNALFAMAIAQRFHLTDGDINIGFKRIQMTGMRLEVNMVQNGMKVINDTYNSSPTSVRSAIQLLLELEPTLEKWVLLGDMNELGMEEESYHREIGEYVAQEKISRIYTIGNRGSWIKEAAQMVNHNPKRVIHHFPSLISATEELLKEGHSNVLLLVKGSRSLQLEQIVTHLIKGE